MGNRAVIETTARDVGVYLHWNGGPDSVAAFLAYCKLKGFRTPDDSTYGWARLCQVVGNYFGGGLSLGVGPCDELYEDNGNNGTYVISGWDVVERRYHEPYTDDHEGYELHGMLREINDAQPEKERIPLPFLDLEADDEIDPLELEPGDYVLFQDVSDVVRGGKVTERPYANDCGVVVVPVAEAFGGSTVGGGVLRTLSAESARRIESKFIDGVWGGE